MSIRTEEEAATGLVPRRKLRPMNDNGTSTTSDDRRQRMHQLLFDEETLDGFLSQMAIIAAETTGGDSSAGVMLLRDGDRATVAASDNRTVLFDEIQYSEGAGPCMAAAQTGATVVVKDVATEDRWPGYAQRSLDHGLCSSLSLPLDLGDSAAGALNMYVFERHTFDDAEVVELSELRDDVSRAISLALRHFDVTTQRDQLHQALGTRRVIDQALGIIMAQNRCSAEEAFGILRQASQNRNVKVRVLAADLIRSATGTEPTDDANFKV